MKTTISALTTICVTFALTLPVDLAADPFLEMEEETAAFGAGEGVGEGEDDPGSPEDDSRAKADGAGMQEEDSAFSQLDEEAEQFEKEKAGPDYDDPEYIRFKEELKAEFEAYRKIALEERNKYATKVGKKWEEPSLSNNKVWIEYSPDLSERSTVDFENETITIETESTGRPGEDERRVKQALTALVKKNRAEAFEGDVISKAVEERSVREIEHIETRKVEPDPILIPYLLGKNQASDEQVDQLVEHMIENQKSSTQTEEKGVAMRKVVVDLSAPEPEKRKTGPPAGLSTRAVSLWQHVDEFADRSEVEPELVFAVIETESAFNPMAKSHVPAYGLMQIVPGSAGIDATEQLFGQGKSRVLAPSYLYDSRKNIEIGATYLNILYHRYLRAIENEESRLYCAIAAYNTGAGNVARSFVGKPRVSTAARKINQMKPQEVYDHLLQNLPHDETRKYLARVSKRRLKYQGQLAH